MSSSTSKGQLYSKKVYAALITLQLITLAGTYLNTRTSLLWVWAISSFVPAVTICLFMPDNRYALPSLLILFVSQQSIFIFANPAWGFSFGSDPINDFHTTSVMSEQEHFELGQLGYATRLSYSYYPMLHLFSVMLSSASGLPLILVALYLVPILNALLTAFALHQLNRDFFGLEGRKRHIATLLFEVGFVYTWFQSQFVRETFAFPLVLLSLWIALRIADLGSSRVYVFMAGILFTAVVLSHLVSSLLFLVILAIIALSYNLFYRNNRLNAPLFLLAVIVGSYTSFVVWTFSVAQALYFYEGVQAIFYREGSPTIMRPHDPWRSNLALVYYAIIGVITLLGGITLLRQKQKNWVRITILSFFVSSFLLCVLLRLSTSAHPWSFTYYMSLRGTIWAFLGVSILLVLGVKYTLKPGIRTSLKNYFVLLLVICLLAAGKFSQYPLLISDPTITPDITYPRYRAALWLKDKSDHGSNILVAPHELDSAAFEGSRDMAPYAYLKEYFLDEERGRTYDKFDGYIPLIGGFFDQYKNLPNVQIIYSNGDVEVGYKG